MTNSIKRIAIEPPYQKTILPRGWTTPMPLAWDDDEHIYWPLKPLCLWLGVDDSTQRLRLLHHRTLGKSMHLLMMEWPIGKRKTWCIEQRAIGYWFGMMDTPRVSEEVSAKLDIFQEQVADYADSLLFGSRTPVTLTPEQLTDLARRHDMDISTLQMAFLMIEKRFGLIEGMIIPSPSDEEESTEEK